MYNKSQINVKVMLSVYIQQVPFKTKRWRNVHFLAPSKWDEYQEVSEKLGLV